MTETTAALNLLDVQEDPAAQGLEDAKKRDHGGLSPEDNVRDHVAVSLGHTEDVPIVPHIPGALSVRPEQMSLLILISFILLKNPRSSPA